LLTAAVSSGNRWALPLIRRPARVRVRSSASSVSIRQGWMAPVFGTFLSLGHLAGINLLKTGTA